LENLHLGPASWTHGSRAVLEEVIRRVTGCGVVSLHTDISTKTGERIIAATLDQNLEARLR
jgi:uncharacterized protein YbcI